MTARLLPRPVTLAVAVDLAVGAICAAVGGAVAGGWGAVSIGCGFLIVVAFFSASAIAVLAAERISVQLTLPVALTVYLSSIGLLGLLVGVVGDDGLLRREAVGFAVLGAVVVWLAAQLTATIRGEPSRGRGQ